MKQQSTGTIIELKDVSYRYPDGSVGLDRCSLSIQHGSRTALLGANGAGKTTLFLHLNGILRPQAGTILFGCAPLDYSRQGLHNLRSRIGLVFQNPDSQLFSASVREDVSFGPMNMGLEHSVVRKRIEESLAAVGLADMAEKTVHNLSHGQKKRVCIAGVLAMQPEVIILDEPMAGLDVPMQRELHAILDRLHTEGVTVLVTTHDIDFAYQWADHLLIMVEGSCAADWGTDELNVLPQLATFGIGVPRVAELCNIMADDRLTNIAANIPRSYDELTVVLRNSLASKGRNQ